MNYFIEIENLLAEIIENILSNQNQLKKYQTDGDFSFTRIVGAIPDEDLNTMLPAYTVRVLSGKNKIESLDIKVAVKIGIFDTDSLLGYEKIRELTEKVLDGVITEGLLGKSRAEEPYTGVKPQLTGKYEILTDADFEIYEEQPYPFWISVLFFTIRPISKYRNDLDDFINYGSIY